MDVKRYHIEVLEETYGKYVLYDDIKHLPQLIEELREALMWCSGSADFGEGGKARVGWLKCCEPLLRDDIKHRLTDPVHKSMVMYPDKAVCQQCGAVHELPKKSDPAEVERLVDMLIIAAQEMGHAMAIEKVMKGHSSDLNKARADLLKAIQS